MSPKAKARSSSALHPLAELAAQAGGDLKADPRVGFLIVLQQSGQGEAGHGVGGTDAEGARGSSFSSVGCSRLTSSIGERNWVALTARYSPSGVKVTPRFPAQGDHHAQLFLDGPQAFGPGVGWEM